jgi:hypothetical protein
MRVEHYYTKTSKKALQCLVAEAFVVGTGTSLRHSSRGPADPSWDETWQVMLEVAEVHEAERAECVKALEAFPGDRERWSGARWKSRVVPVALT